MPPFTVLDEKAEDELHARRLLRVEERAFERVRNRLINPGTPIQTFLSRPTKNPKSTELNPDEPASEEEQSTTETSPEDHSKFLKDLERFRKELILDFAAFEASIARIQFLQNANEMERQRYAAEKVKIESTAEDVRQNTSNLKIRLDEAQKTLATRKGYDVLAEKITGDSRLKPRDEQQVNIERLRNEIEELEREGLDFGVAWRERREALGHVVENGLRLRRVVRDEKEPEAEDKADVDEDDREGENADDDDMLDVDEQRREDGSHMGTPRPMDDAPTPLPGVHESGAMTPRSTLAEAEVMTPKQVPQSEQSLLHLDQAHDADMVDNTQRESEIEVPTLKVDDMDTT